MPTKAEWDELNNASRARQQASRGVEPPTPQVSKQTEQPYVNPYRSQYGTDSIEDKGYSEYVKASSASEIARSNGTAEVNDTRIGDQVNFDEVPRSVDDPESGLPAGYVETAVTICVNGQPVDGQFLFKGDTP
jgi:hypothetical protein